MQGQDSLIISYLHHGVTLGFIGCFLSPSSDRFHRCWDRNSLSLVWQITPRSCQMFVLIFLLYLKSSSFPSGRSCLSADQGTIAITNLFDGVDWYSLANQGLVDSLRTTIVDNVITPIISDEAGSLIIGGSCGVVQVLQPFPAMVVQTLELECKRYNRSL